MDGPGGSLTRASPPPSPPPHAGWSTCRWLADAREENQKNKKDKNDLNLFGSRQRKRVFTNPNPNWVKMETEGSDSRNDEIQTLTHYRLGEEEEQGESLTRNPNPNSIPILIDKNREEQTRSEETEREKGMRKSQWAYLAAAQHCCLAGARGEEGRAPGEASRRTQAKGASWPGRLTAARSPAGERARRRGGRRRRRGPARSRRRLLFVRLARLREKKGERNDARVPGRPAVAGFVSPSSTGDRRIRSDGWRQPGHFRPRRDGEIPAQNQVAA